MEEKIKFYEEALAADPNSTLFFPLAELYRKQGEAEKAIDVLIKGLAGHPEHLRARCLLVSLLHGKGASDELSVHLAAVTDTLEKNPDLWLAWAEKLDREGQKGAALAAYCLTAFLRGTATSWADLLEQGLRDVVPALAGQRSSAQTAESERESEGAAMQAASEQTAPGIEAPKVTADAADESTPAPGELPDHLKAVRLDLGPKAAELQPMIEVEQVQPSSSEHEEDVLETPEDLEDEETEATIRTKTMADILVDQGDYDKALEIYEEILDREDAEEQHEEIRQSIASVREKLSDSKEKKLLSTLEKLAEKLESKAASSS